MWWDVQPTHSLDTPYASLVSFGCSASGLTGKQVTFTMVPGSAKQGRDPKHPLGPRMIFDMGADGALYFNKLIHVKDEGDMLARNVQQCLVNAPAGELSWLRLKDGANNTVFLTPNALPPCRAYNNAQCSAWPYRCKWDSSSGTCENL